MHFIHVYIYIHTYIYIHICTYIHVYVQHIHLQAYLSTIRRRYFHIFHRYLQIAGVSFHGMPGPGSGCCGSSDLGGGVRHRSSDASDQQMYDLMGFNGV